jgi:hypothetical protein
MRFFLKQLCDTDYTHIHALIKLVIKIKLITNWLLKTLFPRK